jgi:ATP-binding cassette subfamily B protein
MNSAVYKHLLLTYGRRPSIWIGLVLELIRSIVLRVLQPLIMAQVAAHLAASDFGGVQRYILYFLICSVLGSLIGAAGDLISLRTENDQYGQLIMEYYRKLTGKDMAFYRDHQSGYLVSLFRQYLDSLLQLIRFIRGDAIRSGVSLVLPALVLLFINLRLGLIAMAVIALQLVYIVWASARVNVFRAQSHEIYRKVTGEVADIITNMTAYKSSGVERQARARMLALAREETRVFWDRRMRAIMYDLPRDILTAGGITLAFLVVATGTTNGSASVGLIVLALMYMFQISRNVSDLPNLMAAHDDLITKAYPTLAYLGDDHETILDPPKPKELKLTKGAIELDDVWFSYPDHAGSSRIVPVFEGLTMSIHGGEQIGIVGLSGAGKSTLASLLLRFDDINRGAIRIDGADIREVRQSDLRRHIAYVPQEPLLFHRSIRENIAYFNTEATQQDIQRAAQAAHAHDFITRLPGGYDSLVGERGVKLSGGQKQRVVIARAILKNAPIMIFDEATSALDTESERIIQRALPEILGPHTAIVIAHRLSTIAGLDRILVMHHGAIVEEGTHAELLEAHGRYYSLWQKQAGHREPVLPA